MAAFAGGSVAPVVVGPGEGTAVWYVNNRMTVKVGAAETGGRFSLTEALVPPGHAPPLHVHRTQDEALWVLEGGLTVRCGDQTHRAGPGALVFVPRGTPHTFRPEGATPTRMLVMMTPAGGEGYFVEGGRPAQGPGLPPPSEPDVARLKALAPKYGMDFVGPPL